MRLLAYLRVFLRFIVLIFYIEELEACVLYAAFKHFILYGFDCVKILFQNLNNPDNNYTFEMVVNKKTRN